MAYISYTGLPIYFGTGVGGQNHGNTPFMPTESDGGNRNVYAQQVQLNYTPNIAPVRLIGKKPTNQNFNLAGPSNASLSFSCYIAPSEFNPKNYTGDVGNTGATFRIGDSTTGISGSGLFLNSFSYTVTPYAPILVQCDFAILNPLTIDSAGGKMANANNNNVMGDLDFGEYAHGVYSKFSGDSQTAAQTLDDISIFESIQYQYTAQRLPIYEVGSFNLQKCELITEEQTLTIQGDNIQKLVPITGSSPGKLTIVLKGTGANPILTSNIDGRIVAENISVQGGDLARGSLTITELLK